MTPLSPIAQGAEGLALAVSFALLGTWRTRSLILLCAAQAALVAVAAVTQMHDGCAAVALALAALLAWAARSRRGLPDTGPAALPVLPFSPRRIATGGILAVLATATQAGGIGLAIVLLGLLLVAERAPHRQALGIVALQNGLLLAGVSRGLSGWHAVPVDLPLLPAAAFVGLWLPRAGSGIGRRRAAARSGRLEAALCLLALLAAGTLPWLTGHHAAPFRSITARNAQIVLLVAALAAAAGWRDRHAAPLPGTRLAILAGIAFAVLSNSALAGWLGMGVAALSAAAAALPHRPRAWKRLMLATAGLALALSGIVSLQTRPSLAAAGLLLLGYGMLALLAPELAIAAAALALRLPGGLAIHLLQPAGLTALLLAAAGLLAGNPRQVASPLATSPQATSPQATSPLATSPQATSPQATSPQATSPLATLRLVDLAQAGIAVFAFGLGTPPAALAGVLQLTLLALARCATRLARPEGLDGTVALAGLAGVPPFGVFASLALILAATAAEAPWLLAPLVAGLAVVAWTLLRRLPAARHLVASPAWLPPAWLPLALALLCGLAMPGPLLAWFRLAAQ